MRKVYDKLVRDRIPDIIRQSGSECATETFSPDEFRRALRDKLVEEAREAANASDDDLLIELADVEEHFDGRPVGPDVRPAQGRDAAEDDVAAAHGSGPRRAGCDPRSRKDDFIKLALYGMRSAAPRARGRRGADAVG